MTTIILLFAITVLVEIIHAWLGRITKHIGVAYAEFLRDSLYDTGSQLVNLLAIAELERMSASDQHIDELVNGGDLGGLLLVGG